MCSWPAAAPGPTLTGSATGLQALIPPKTGAGTGKSATAVEH